MKNKIGFKILERYIDSVEVPGKDFGSKDKDIERERIKKKYKAMRIRNNIWLITVCALTLFMIAFGIAVTYWIGTSNLPDWVKFLLLR